MLSPPHEPAEDALATALTGQWGVALGSVDYRPVGFGSHHWTVTDPAGGGWFVTVADLDTKRRSAAESRDDVCGRLRGALGTARALRGAGRTFVPAPVPTAGGDLVVRLTDRYAMSLYPLIDGESFEFGAYADDEHRSAVLEMVIRVHTAPATVRGLAADDDLDVPNRDALAAALDGPEVAASGPYTEPAARLLAEHAGALRASLARYDALAAGADRGRAVLTHGKPHPANTLRGKDGWWLAGWDAVLVAPPERDLWLLGGAPAAYTEATGMDVRPDMLEMFRLRWDLAHLAVEVDRFRRPHSGDPNDDNAWSILRSVVSAI